MHYYNINPWYFLIFFWLSFFLATIFTYIVRNYALKRGIVDKPGLTRKIHEKETALLGGVAIFVAFFVALFFARDILVSGNLNFRHWIGFFVGGVFLMIGGYLDDRLNLSPKKQFIWPFLATLAVVLGGVGIEKISNPFGGAAMSLAVLQIPVLAWRGVMHHFVVIADTFTILWLLGAMYTTKLLDGMDGLVSTVTAVGSFMIFLFTMTTKYYQPDIGLAALILSGVCLGFLVFNWHPASIFLGEGGSVFLGFALGVLAIISGGKIAMALLIIGIPMLDVVWVIVRRLRAGKNPFRFADREHLHFRLLDLGIGQRKTVLIYAMFSLVFGACALFLQSFGKIFALIVMSCLMIAMIIGFNIIDRKKI